MRVDDFTFELPSEQIAQTPADSREESRLMVLDRKNRVVDTGSFVDIVDELEAGDVLVLNDTRVFPARLYGRKTTGGKIEIMLVRRLGGNEEWLCLIRSSRIPQVGAEIVIDEQVTATVQAREDDRHWRLSFRCPGDFLAHIESAGHIPLPPYIRREDTISDRSRYQTVFARESGSVAAPTAGLHFTNLILQQLREKGIEIHFLTLHVGPGTFTPVQVENIKEHRMHSELFTVPAKTAEAVNRAKGENRRIVAVGTTTTRTLEYFVDDQGRLKSGTGKSDLFISPGFEFKIIDALVTNFHLPKSTLLMLVCAFGGREFILNAYNRAIAEGFRFYSYGDCMLIK